MLGAAVTVAFSLHDGFERAADRADLPDVIARFDQRDLSTVRDRVGALPNVAGVSYRYEERRVHLLVARVSPRSPAGSWRGCSRAGAATPSSPAATCATAPTRR